MKELLAAAAPDLSATESVAVCEVLAAMPEGVLDNLRANGEALRNLIALVRKFVESGQLTEIIAFAKLIMSLFALAPAPTPAPGPVA